MPTKTNVLNCACATLCAALLMAIALPLQAAAADRDDPPGRVARLSYDFFSAGGRVRLGDGDDQSPHDHRRQVMGRCRFAC